MPRLNRFVRPHRLSLVLACMLAASAAPGCLKVPDEGSETPGLGEAPETAQQLLDRYISAIGGQPAVAAIAHRTMEARMTLKAEEGCDPDTAAEVGCLAEDTQGSFTLQKSAGNLLYRRTVIGEQVEERGYDGKTGWHFAAGRVLLDDAQMAVISREDAILHWYLGLPTRGVNISLETPRDTDFEGKPAALDGLRWEVTGSPMSTKTMWFDRNTGLLSEELLEGQAGDQAMRQWMIYSDYRDVDGVKIPFQIRMINELGDRKQEIVFATVSVDHKPIDAQLYQVPAPSQAKPVPDTLLAALADARAAAGQAPKDAATQIAYARLAWAAAHFDEAEQAAKATLARDKGEVEALWILARLRVMQGKWSEARNLLIKAQKAGVSPSLIAAQMVWVWSHQRKFSEAANALEAAGPGNAPLAGRYRSFVGNPLNVQVSKSCQATVPLASDTPLAVVNVAFGGTQVPLVIDTAATDLIIDTDLAAKIGATIRARTPLDKNGNEMGHGQVGSMGIGDLTIKNVPVDVLPPGAMAQLPGKNPPRGVLGLRVLEQFQVTFDMPARMLELVPRSGKCKKQQTAHRTDRSHTFWLHEGHYLYTLANINQSEGFFWVNTGMQGAAVAANEPAYARAGVAPPPVRPGDVSMVSLASMSIADVLRVAKPQGAYGYVTHQETADKFRADGMVGLALLGQGRWTIDFDTRKFYFADSRGAAK